MQINIKLIISTIFLLFIVSCSSSHHPNKKGDKIDYYIETLSSKIEQTQNRLAANGQVTNRAAQGFMPSVKMKNTSIENTYLVQAVEFPYYVGDVMTVLKKLSKQHRFNLVTEGVVKPTVVNIPPTNKVYSVGEYLQLLSVKGSYNFKITYDPNNVTITYK